MLDDGIQVPAPGSGEDLPDLNPINPTSTDPAVKDTRTRAQRLLDTLIDVVTLAARTATLPTNGGLRPQLFLTINHSDLHTGHGTALSPYTGPNPLNAYTEILCDCHLSTIITNENQILNVKRTQRLVPPHLRKALLARDQGCTFPDCTRPGHWTEAHHIIPWHTHGETSLENCTLLCTYHHHLIHRTDWTITMINGTPHYTPPYLIDPTQQPRTNTYHHAQPPPGTGQHR